MYLRISYLVSPLGFVVSELVIRSTEQDHLFAFLFICHTYVTPFLRMKIRIGLGKHFFVFIQGICGKISNYLISVATFVHQSQVILCLKLRLISTLRLFESISLGFLPNKLFFIKLGQLMSSY